MIRHRKNLHMSFFETANKERAGFTEAGERAKTFVRMSWLKKKRDPQKDMLAGVFHVEKSEVTES